MRMRAGAIGSAGGKRRETWRGRHGNRRATPDSSGRSGSAGHPELLSLLEISRDRLRERAALCRRRCSAGRSRFRPRVRGGASVHERDHRMRRTRGYRTRGHLADVAPFWSREVSRRTIIEQTGTTNKVEARFRPRHAGARPKATQTRVCSHCYRS